MVRGHHLHGVGERDLRVLVAVSELITHESHESLVRFLVATRCREVEVRQLQHRLEVLDRRRAVHPLHVLGDLCGNRDGLARQGFLQLGSGETSYTAYLNQRSSYLCRRQVLGLHLAQTTFRESLHEDLVRFEVCRMEDHFDAVGEDPLRGLYLFVLTERFNLALMRRLLHEFGVDHLLYGCFNRQFALSGDSRQNGLLGWDIHPFFLRTGDSDGRVRMDKRFRYIIHGLQRYERQNRLHEIVLPLSTRHGLAVFEITDTLPRQGDVTTGVTLVVVFLHRVHLLALDALQLGIGKAVTVHLLELEEQVIEGLGLTSLFRDHNAVESIHLLRCLAILTSGTGEGRFGVLG